MLLENPVFGWNFQLFWSQTHFCGSGPPKNLPGAYVYKGILAGLPTGRFWAEKSLLGSQNAKNGEIQHFRATKWEKVVWFWKAGVVLLKTTRNTNVLGERKMMIFCKSPTFYIKISIFTENAKYFARFSQLCALFRPARPGCARAIKTNGIPYIFCDFWGPWAIFRKMYFLL